MRCVRVVVGFPASWVLYGLGHLVSMMGTWTGPSLAKVYVWSMTRAMRVQDWAEITEWGPWGERQDDEKG